VVAAVLADYRTAAIPERLRAVLGLLEKLAHAPAEVGPADIAPLYAAGLDDEAIEDALEVSAAFHFITRVADTLGFEVPPDRVFDFHARRLLKVGYTEAVDL
jgi:alkylhydroperoxidase family enzyme